MNIKEFLEKGLLIKSPSSLEEQEGSLAIAEEFLEKAKGNYGINYFDVAFSLAYQSMFHAARALLFKNNFKERSHGALIAAVKELYAANGALRKLLETMNAYRMTRHAVQYSGLGCSKEDAEDAMQEAKRLLDAVEKILAKKIEKK